MADKSYPSNLPRTDLTSYSYGISTHSLRTELNQALYYRRRRTDIQIYTVNVSMIYSDSEMEDFRNWYTVDLTNGSEIFNMELAFGDGIKTNEAKFVGGDFSYSYLEGNNDWSVSAQLEVWDPNILEDASIFINSTFDLSGSIGFSVPLSLGNYESQNHILKESFSLELSEGTYENQSYEFEADFEVDLSTGTYEDGGGSPTPSSISPDDDAYVRGGTFADTNFGSSVNLEGDNGSTANRQRNVYLRFDVSSIVGTVASASLDLYINTCLSDDLGLTVALTSDTWDESTVTFDTKPSFSSTLDFWAIETSDAGSIVSFNDFSLADAINTAISGDGIISIGIFFSVAQLSDTPNITIASSEDSNLSRKPSIALTYL